jgi:hypothetical protein
MKEIFFLLPFLFSSQNFINEVSAEEEFSQAITGTQLGFPKIDRKHEEV